MNLKRPFFLRRPTIFLGFLIFVLNQFYAKFLPNLITYCQGFITPNTLRLPSNGSFILDMVSSRKVQSFTNRARKNKSQASKTVPKANLKKKVQKRKRHIPETKAKAPEKVEKDEMLERFGIDMGPFGNELYKWLWPSDEPCQQKEKEHINSLRVYNRFLESRFISNNEREPSDELNRNFHCHLLHNYASERFVDIFKRLAFHMRISPRVLFREVGAITGKFGINILDTSGDVTNSEAPPESTHDPRILSLHKAKFQAYTLLGAKLLRYTMLFFLRYIRLGIPTEVKLRVLSDVMKREFFSRAATLPFNQIDFGEARNDPLNQTYPIRTSFETQGYPYSDSPLFTEVPAAEARSPSKLVDEDVFRNLSKKNRSKLVCIAASLHPEYALQIVKNIVFSAGFNSEREFITNFSLNSTFNSRGARSFLLKLKEERLADEKLRLAAKLSRGLDEPPGSLKEALEILSRTPYLSGLIRRHLESGHRVTSLNRARMILKLVTSEVQLKPADMSLWDVLKGVISRRVLNAPSTVYKQVAKQILALKNYLAPNLPSEIERRGIDPTGLYRNIQERMDNLDSLSREEKIELAREIRKNTRAIWLNGGPDSLEDTGIYLVDALAAAAGFKDLNNVLAIVSILSKRPQSKLERFSRQPGTEFEHSPRLEFKDFKGKVV